MQQGKRTGTPRGARRRSALTRSCRTPTGSDQRGARRPGGAPTLPVGVCRVGVWADPIGLPRATRSSETSRRIYAFSWSLCVSQVVLYFVSRSFSRSCLFSTQKTRFSKLRSDRRITHLCVDPNCVVIKGYFQGVLTCFRRGKTTG